MEVNKIVTETGAAWRKLMNFLGDRPIEPSILIPLMRHMGVEERDLTSKDLLEDLEFLSIGYSLWKSQRNALYEWVRQSPNKQLSEMQFEEWWWYESGRTNLLLRDERERVEDFFSTVQLDRQQTMFLREFEAENPNTRDVHIYYLRRDMVWLYELELFRTLANETWGFNAPLDVRWDWEQLAFLDKYFSEQQPSLRPMNEDDELIDPFSLRVKYHEMGVGFGLHELAVELMIIVRNSVIDFMQEVFDFGRYHYIRGSLRCTECGQFAARRERGYGQQYCSERCKKRAAKRRYRLRTETRELM